MSTLRAILAAALGCSNRAEYVRGGRDECIQHLKPWPCDALTDLEAQVMEWHEAEESDVVGDRGRMTREGPQRLDQEADSAEQDDPWRGYPQWTPRPAERPSAIGGSPF